MSDSSIQLKILELEHIHNLCNEILSFENLNSKNAELEKVLKQNYNLNQEDIKSIFSIVKGKKKTNFSSKNNLDSLRKKLDAYCIAADINTRDRNDDFIGYSKIKIRTSNKKAILHKKLRESEN